MGYLGERAASWAVKQINIDTSGLTFDSPYPFTPIYLHSGKPTHMTMYGGIPVQVDGPRMRSPINKDWVDIDFNSVFTPYDDPARLAHIGHGINADLPHLKTDKARQADRSANAREAREFGKTAEAFAQYKPLIEVAVKAGAVATFVATVARLFVPQGVHAQDATPPPDLPDAGPVIGVGQTLETTISWNDSEFCMQVQRDPPDDPYNNHPKAGTPNYLQVTSCDERNVHPELNSPRHSEFEGFWETLTFDELLAKDPELAKNVKLFSDLVALTMQKLGLVKTEHIVACSSQVQSALLKYPPLYKFAAGFAAGSDVCAENVIPVRDDGSCRIYAKDNPFAGQPKPLPPDRFIKAEVDAGKVKLEIDLSFGPAANDPDRLNRDEMRDVLAPVVGKGLDWDPAQEKADQVIDDFAKKVESETGLKMFDGEGRLNLDPEVIKILSVPLVVEDMVFDTNGDVPVDTPGYVEALEEAAGAGAAKVVLNPNLLANYVCWPVLAAMAAGALKMIFNRK
ncbi:MAG: hypothetical protein AAB874_05165 [Patescibacteria group bacterium]